MQSKYHLFQLSPAAFYKRGVIVLAATLLLFITGGAGKPENIEPIALQAEPLPFTPEEFYIANLLDERADKQAVAWLLPISPSHPGAVKPQPVDLHGGGARAIHQFIKGSLAADTALRPVIIRLRECKITETPLTDGSVEGSVVISMAFELQKGDETVPLTEYRGSARYIRASTQHTIVEKALRQSLASSLSYLNNWMNQEAPHNIKLARGIEISFKYFTEQADGDTVFHDTAKPLQWDDFQGKPNSGKYAASVFANFGYKNDSKVEDGTLKLSVSMRVYMLKNMSWVRNNARDTYGLNHEQRHFDLAKLVAERFKKKILEGGLTMEDFDGQIGYFYLESYREMNKLQEQYDEETDHGLNLAAQDRWNKQIAQELTAFQQLNEK